ncbi:hypothetical protein PAXRUDRAFT_829096 [Paxillus rubicundulus Ve08.2h10]|uniref:Uncharacterized protein n=1 Tax=Paxillus rubicundulus Ve08.2h10 TaxID=930991 RepID=A0A0D0E6H0_9AGAM|nr:hypothetical protein PAXRUDRAFT_829096 [Paxillus rubicundulus Ve08.2h10]
MDRKIVPPMILRRRNGYRADQVPSGLPTPLYVSSCTYDNPIPFAPLDGVRCRIHHTCDVVEDHLKHFNSSFPVNRDVRPSVDKGRNLRQSTSDRRGAHSADTLPNIDVVVFQSGSAALCWDYL